MSYFFNGRLYESPAVMSKVDDSALFSRGLSVGNVLAVLGESTGGKPNTALRFGSAEEARATLVSGPLLDAIKRAFDPSNETAAPAEIIGIRVNPATQSTLALRDATSNTVINLASTDYGLRTAQIKVKLEAGANTGKKITVQLGNDYYAEDDIARNAFLIRYSGGEASARMTITNTQVTLEAPNSTVVATIDLNTFNTVQKLVDRINAVSGFAASVLDGHGAKATVNGLDSVANVDVRTADYTAKADLQAIVDWFNGTGEGFVTATRAAGAGAVPANIAFTYLSGGAEGSLTNSEWGAGFTTLQSIDVQWVTVCTATAAIHAMADAHVKFMSDVSRQERRAIVGSASGTTDAAAIVLAKAINSDRTSLVHIGGYDYNDDGELVLYEPWIVAAMVAGAFCGLNPGSALTAKSLKLRGLERKLRNPTDTDVLLRGGVMPIEDAADGYRVVKSISTWLTNRNYNRVEQSVGVALDYTARTVRERVKDLVGAKGSPQTLGLAAARVETALRELATPEPSGPGVLVGDAENPAYKGITVTLNGDAMKIAFQCSPVIPVNYIPVTIYAVPYSGSVSI